MSDRFYRVNPADPTDIDPTAYPLRRAVTNWDGSIPFTVVGAAPIWDLYLAVPDDTPTPQYHDRVLDTLTFSGTIQGEDGRVHETRNFVPWDIERLYKYKEQAIADQDAEIRYGTADSQLSANWWIIVSEKARHELAELVSWLERPDNDYPPDGHEKRPRFGVFNAANGRVRREQLDEAQYDQTVRDIVEHGQAVGDATFASGESLDAKKAAYDANPSPATWQAVADHDPADPAWGYPASPAGMSSF